MSSVQKAIGPYSIYRECGGLFYLSGQLPVGNKAGMLVSQDIKEQTKQCLQNIGNILKELNLGYDNIVKTTVFLSNMDDFTPMNEVYATFFNPPYPSRSCVAVKEIPMGAKVEIEVIVSK